MSVQAKRFALLLAAFGIIAVSLVACQTPNSANQGTSNTILIPTQNSSNLTPTPKFPPFTIGAWPSNASPQLNDSVTIYISCRVQDQSMQGPSQPAPGLAINISVGNPVGGTYSARTGPDGYAAVTFSFNDSTPGQPVIVDAWANWNGATYHAQTFFTPGPQAPATPTEQATQGGGGGGGGQGDKTPTPGAAGHP